MLLPFFFGGLKTDKVNDFILFFVFFKKVLNYVIRANKLNLTSRTELFVKIKRVELKLKKRFVSNSNWVSSWADYYRVELSSDEFGSTGLISNPMARCWWWGMGSLLQGCSFGVNSGDECYGCRFFSGW